MTNEKDANDLILKKMYIEFWNDIQMWVCPNLNTKQARNQSGQTKPYVSRLGSCQCCTLKLKYRIAMNLAFLGIFWTYTEK